MIHGGAIIATQQFTAQMAVIARIIVFGFTALVYVPVASAHEAIVFCGVLVVNLRKVIRIIFSVCRARCSRWTTMA